MSLQSTFPSQIPEQTQVIGEAILDQDDVCYYLDNHITEILNESDFVEMYSSTGRGGVHPLILSMVTVCHPYSRSSPTLESVGVKVGRARDGISRFDQYQCQMGVIAFG